MGFNRNNWDEGVKQLFQVRPEGKLNNCVMVHFDDASRNDDYYNVTIFQATKSADLQLVNVKTASSNNNKIDFSGYSLYNCAGCGFAATFVVDKRTKELKYVSRNYSYPDFAKNGKLDVGLSGTRQLLYSTLIPSDFPDFVGKKEDKTLDFILRLVNDTFQFTKREPVKSFRTCNSRIGYTEPAKYKNNSFCYWTYLPKGIQGSDGANGYCVTFASLSEINKGGNSYVRKDEKTWSVKNEDIVPHPAFPAKESDMTGKVIYTNSVQAINRLKELGYNTTDGVNVKYVVHPSKIPSPDGGYDCSGNPWEDDENPKDKDSSLSGPIKDLLDKHKKTFYLLGMKNAEEAKLYLFNLGNVKGDLDFYTHIEKAIVYKQESCKWVFEADNVTVKFSQFKGEVDTNFYLLTDKKLRQPSTITKITHRKSNEYLLKYFKTCTITRPEGGKDPDDNLKPEWGGGGSDGSGPNIDGGGIDGGYNPKPPTPLPNPDVPNCSDKNGASLTPVSEIYLLKVPELEPSYENTYDFPAIDQQERFFKSKGNLIVKNYTYIRKNNAIMVGSHLDNLHCYNYLMYKNKFGKWYYCFIMSKEYINESTTRVIIATDVIQTYLFDYTVGPCYVERCHVPRWDNFGNPTKEYEPEGLEFGEPIQESSANFGFDFSDTYIAICSNPLGEIESRSVLKKAEGGEK